MIPLAIVYVWFFIAHIPSHPKTLNVLGADANITLYTQPNSGRQPLLDAIKSAQKEISVEMYLLSDKQIIAALEDARARGLDVKVILEQHPFDSASLNTKSKQELDAKGVETEWSDPAFALTHEKTIIIDASEALILSQNLTASAFTKNREYDVLDTNPLDVAEIQMIFFDDWKRTSFSPPANSNIIESPDNSRSALTTLITSATTTIDAETEDIDDDNFINSLIQKTKTVQVRLLVPTLSQVSSNNEALKRLATGGVDVKTISSPYMHAKMILEDDSKAYVGSINFSTQSMDQNREVGIILTQPDSLQTLESTFETDWGDAQPFSK